jgi:DNA-binding CsgD family transcriptional regulator
MPIALPAPQGLMTCICLERDTDFSDRDLQLMQLVRPHVVQMYRNAEMFSLLRDATRSGQARSIVLDKAGRPLIATQEAWDLLSVYFPGHSGLEEFPRPVISWLERELARLARPQDMPPPASSYIAETRNGDRLKFRLLLGNQTGEQALLVLEEQRTDRPAKAWPQLGLSPREEHVLLLVREGRSSAEIAAGLVISRRTVEKHLENIYCKLGVDNRTAAVAVAFSAEHAG